MFNARRLDKVVWLCADNLEAIPVGAFCAMLDEIVNLLGALGKALFMAFKDVKDKALDMKKNKEFIVNTMNKPDDITLQQIVLLEVELGVIKCAGDNNSKVLPKSKKDSWEWTYTSVGRHLVRCWWLSHFMAILFTTLVHQ